MFERRLKIFLGFLVLVTVGLLTRAVQVQVFERDEWITKAAKLSAINKQTETFRGRILDASGKVMAQDSACTDACVDFRVISNPPDGKWISDFARNRLITRMGKKDYDALSSAQRIELKNNEIKQVNIDIETMWNTLAELYQPATEDVKADHRAAIEDIRHGIEQRVEMRRRWVWYKNFQLDKTKMEDAPRWRKWLAGSSEDGPDIDRFDVPVDEETQSHVILRALDGDACNLLAKRLERLPGLSLVPSIHREYPMKEVACHLLGRMSRVSATELADPIAKLDEARAYLPNDQVGREGVEALCEPLLRGSRGLIKRKKGDDPKAEEKPFIPGEDVRITIDSELQDELQGMLKHVREKDNARRYITPEPGLDMHGAVVVLNVANNEVLAMASNPTFDLNEIDDRYTALVNDKIDNPLKNRATCDEFEPGSSVKPMIGLAGITQGVVRPLEGIECTGFLVLDNNGVKEKMPRGRCWVASEWTMKELNEKYHIYTYAHHQIPYPHKGHDNNPDGFLTFSDALERSCDVYFENIADRLGPEGMSYWYDQFGFGRKTGVGIIEMRGLRPGQRPLQPGDGRLQNCFTGMGQGQVWATPLQIANEAATIARNGIWMRPRLLATETQARLDSVRPRSPDAPPDAVDLHLDPEGLRQAKLGMVAVIDSDSGTGANAHVDGVLVAGKTGTAQATVISQWVVDQDGKKSREPMPPANNAHPNTGTEWYRSTDDAGKNVVHAWFMGYAPVENPKIAFAVFIEYGGHGGGGGIAGPIVNNLVEACIKHGYLHRHNQGLPMANLSN